MPRPRAGCLTLSLALQLCCCWPLLATEQAAAKPVAGELAAAEIGRRGLALAAKLGIPSQNLAFMVVNPQGQVSAHRAKQPVIPASNLKLVTAAAAPWREATGAAPPMFTVAA